MINIKHLRTRVDFGLITIREDEFEAVLKRFPLTASVEGRRRYGLSHLQTNDGGEYVIALARCHEQGTGEGQSIANDLIEDFDPQWLLLVGIAGGIPADEYTLGDVVAAMRLHDFTISAHMEGNQEAFAIAGGPMHKDVQDLLAYLPAMNSALADWNSEVSIGLPVPPIKISRQNLYGDDQWRKRVRESINRHFVGNKKPPRVTTGSVASSDRLIKDTRIIDEWRQSARQLIAVEMELAGVYRAARKKGKEYPILAVRGISDIVGFKRHADWTAYACNTAAAFTRALLKTKPIEPRSGEITEQYTLDKSDGEWSHQKMVPPLHSSTGLPKTKSVPELEREGAASKKTVTSKSAYKSDLSLPELIVKQERALGIPDLLTPGLPSKRLVELLTPHVGEQLAERLGQLSEASIIAVEKGDFDLHISLGKQIETDSQGFPEIEAAGRYFAAEGYRLQADLEGAQDKKRSLLKKAAEQYELSLERNPSNARAIRGLARVFEVQGDYDKAMNRFRQAEGIALIQLSSEEQRHLHRHLSHEILRITRHHIHCILDILAENPQSVWQREHKKRELEGYVIESENLHRENMALFKDQEQWSRIEWFMGLVFFAKAWGRLGNIQRKTKCLVDALFVRRNMMSDIHPLTNIEQANIKWWIGVALTDPRDTTLAGVEDLAQTLEQANPTGVLGAIDKILFPFVSIWDRALLSN